MLNQILNCDCVDGMRSLPSGFVQLTVTSPPFDEVRDFDGWLCAFDFEVIAQELYRITCDGGVVCWHIQNQINGGESCTAEMQKLYFRDLGFVAHNTIIIDTNCAYLSYGSRYGGAPQYVYVFSKGKPRVFHPIKDVKNKLAGKKGHYRKRDRHGSFGRMNYTTNGEFRQRGNVWQYTTGKHHSADGYEHEHPAIMHIGMARDLITSWSNPCDLVFDPMCGEGTVPTAARQLNRHYLGMEISPYWSELARQRVENFALSGTEGQS